MAADYAGIQIPDVSILYIWGKLHTFVAMINPKFILLLLAACSVLAWACAPKQTPAQTTTDITEAIGSGNFDEAKYLADKLVGDSKFDTNSLGVEHLCLLAVAAVRLGEHSEQSDEYNAFGLKCYEAAIARSVDSTQNYISQLPSADFACIDFLNQLIRPIDARRSGMVYTVNEEGEDDFSLPDSLHNHGN